MVMRHLVEIINPEIVAAAAAALFTGHVRKIWRWEKPCNAVVTWHHKCTAFVNSWYILISAPQLSVASNASQPVKGPISACEPEIWHYAERREDQPPLRGGCNYIQEAHNELLIAWESKMTYTQTPSSQVSNTSKQIQINLQRNMGLITPVQIMQILRPRKPQKHHNF